MQKYNKKTFIFKSITAFSGLTLTAEKLQK